MNAPAKPGSGFLSPALLLRFEGLALAGLSLFLFHRVGESWWLLLLWLAPDLSFAGYVAGPRLGAALYNSVHNLLLPAVLVVYGIVVGSALLVALALVWLSHLGVDRLLGYGLKYPTEFRDTHMGRV